MSASTKLSSSVKALCYLANSYPDPKNSKRISEQIGVNASKLRKILSLLVKNNIVKSNQGQGGGFLIAKDIENLNLQEIYCAIEDRKAFHLNVSETHGNGKSETQNLNNFFLSLFDDIQVDIEEKMKKITLKSILDQT